MCLNLSESACVMEMRGGIRRGRVVGRDTLLRTSGERVRSRGRSQQGTCRVRKKGSPESISRRASYVFHSRLEDNQKKTMILVCFSGMTNSSSQEQRWQEETKFLSCISNYFITFVNEKKRTLWWYWVHEVTIKTNVNGKKNVSSFDEDKISRPEKQTKIMLVHDQTRLCKS